MKVLFLFVFLVVLYLLSSFIAWTFIPGEWVLFQRSEDGITLRIVVSAVVLTFICALILINFEDGGTDDLGPN